jgi:hypothetical protein
MGMSDWDWQLYPDTERAISGLVRSFLDGNGYASAIGRDIGETSSTRFIDWVDSMEVPEEMMSGIDLERIGFVKDPRVGTGGPVYIHPGKFFPIRLRGDRSFRLSINVDDLELFLVQGHLADRKIMGERNATLRSVDLHREGDCTFCAVERHGAMTFDVQPEDDSDEYETALRALTARRRTFGEDAEGIDDLGATIVSLGDGLEMPRLADAFFSAERNFWQSKNRAGAMQSRRQGLMGLGWGNRDHHTFRCSRENFRKSIAIFEQMGMTRRERFFAAAEAGWGAQIMEQAGSRLVVFADVDLSPDEGQRDFVDRDMEPLERPGTVGLWVGLHGESLLDAGMHHLAVGSDFRDMREDLRVRDVPSMGPFSNFDFLKQSFTEAERWTPPRERVDRLLRDGLITDEQATRFKEKGTVGSHLEVIQRDQGFKGFNQSSVSAIIRMTDPKGRLGMGA